MKSNDKNDKNNRNSKDQETPAGRYRSVEPSTPLSRRQHLIAGTAIVLILVILTISAISVDNWRRKQELASTDQESVGTSSSPSDSDPQNIEDDNYTDAILIGDPYKVADSAKNRTSILVGIDEGIDIVNPLYSSSDGEKDLVSLIFEPLIKIDLHGNPSGVLAKSWNFDSKSKELSFQIEPGHLFRDGRAVEAQDVIYTYECLKSESYNGPFKGRFDEIVSIAPGNLDNSVVFQLSETIENPDYRIFTMGILKSDYYNYSLDQVFLMFQDARLPEGSGAYEVISLSSDQAEIALRSGFAGSIKEIGFIQIASEDKIDMLKSGEIDLIRNRWDERMKIRADSLEAYNFFPSATRIESYLLIGRQPEAGSELADIEVRNAVLSAAAGKDITNEQKELLGKIEKPLKWFYFLGVDSNVSTTNINTLTKLSEPLAELGIDVKPEGIDWPEMAARAASGSFDLMLLPAPSNSRLPENTVILDSSSSANNGQAANAWPAIWHDEVIIASARLQQLTINEAGFPLASATASWTDRLQNARFFNYSEHN